MEYDKIRNKVNKFYKGGKIPKLEDDGYLKWRTQFGKIGWDESDYFRLSQKFADGGDGSESLDEYIQNQLSLEQEDLGMTSSGLNSSIKVETPKALGPSANDQQNISQNAQNLINKSNDLVKKAATAKSAEDYGKAISGVDFSKDASWRDKTELSDAGAMGMGIASQLGTGITNAVDELTMGDKNFGAKSAAIDSAVHGVSGALMSSGNPYAMAAGAALEGANFLTKAGGQTVQGFDVNIENSGFGTLGHMESSSSRDFGAMIGLGGLNGDKMQAKLARRNEQARMAMQAAEISEDIKFEQEARMNSIDNVLRNNQIALAGGIDTNLLGS